MINKAISFLALIVCCIALRQPSPGNYSLKEPAINNTAIVAKTTDESNDTITEEWKELKLSANASLVSIYIDDVITSLYVNRNKIAFHFSDAVAKHWDTRKDFNLVLFAGDIITIGGKNTAGFGGILANLKFFDVNGKEYNYPTNEKWFCNGKPALITGLNNGKETGPYHPDINAQWIWAEVSNNVRQEVLCSLKIPCY